MKLNWQDVENFTSRVRMLICFNSNLLFRVIVFLTFYSCSSQKKYTFSNFRLNFSLHHVQCWKDYDWAEGRKFNESLSRNVNVYRNSIIHRNKSMCIGMWVYNRMWVRSRSWCVPEYECVQELEIVSKYECLPEYECVPEI